MAHDTFLHICQEVLSKLGMQGSLITTVGVSGYQETIVDLVSTAWRDLQNQREDYYFLQTDTTLDVVANTQTYTLDTNVAGTGDLDSRILITSVAGAGGNMKITIVGGETAGAETTTVATNGDITIGIEDGVSTEAQVATAIAAASTISTAVADGVAVWILGVNTDTVTLTGARGAIFADSSRFGKWRSGLFLYNYRPLRYIPYNTWIQKDRANQVSRPTCFTIDPADDDLIFQNLSTDATITLSYTKSPQLFTADADVPEVPRRNRDVIVWAGVLACSEFFGNSDAETKANKNYEKSLGVFFRQQVPSQSVTTPALVMGGCTRRSHA